MKKEENSQSREQGGYSMYPSKGVERDVSNKRIRKPVKAFEISPVKEQKPSRASNRLSQRKEVEK